MCRSTSLSLSFSPLRTAILAVANKHAALSPRHRSLQQHCLQIPGHPAAQQKGILAPGQRRKLGLSWVCGAGSGVAGRCGAGTELIAAVSPPASSRFISSPLGCRPGERGINRKSSFILRNGLAPFYTELKAPRLKRWQRREQGGVPRRELGASLSSLSAVGTERGWGQWLLALAPS